MAGSNWLIHSLICFSVYISESTYTLLPHPLWFFSHFCSYFIPILPWTLGDCLTLLNGSKILQDFRARTPTNFFNPNFQSLSRSISRISHNVESYSPSSARHPRHVLRRLLFKRRLQLYSNPLWTKRCSSPNPSALTATIFTNRFHSSQMSSPATTRSSAPTTLPVLASPRRPTSQTSSPATTRSSAPIPPRPSALASQPPPASPPSCKASLHRPSMLWAMQRLGVSITGCSPSRRPKHIPTHL